MAFNQWKIDDFFLAAGTSKKQLEKDGIMAKSSSNDNLFSMGEMSNLRFTLNQKAEFTRKRNLNLSEDSFLIIGVPEENEM